MVDRLRALPWWLRTSVSVGFGACAALAFQPFGWWPLVFVAVAGLSLLAVTARGWGVALLTGLFFGVGFLGIALTWMQVIFVEALFGLVAVESLFYAAIAALIRLAAAGRAWPILAAGAWSVGEFTFSRFPFDGFGWMRLAFSVIDTPLAGFLPFIGVPGVSFLTALVGQALALVILVERVPQRLLAAAAAAGIFVSGFAGSLFGVLGADHLVTAGSVNVGYVQGNAPGGGVYGLGEPRTITRNHLAETERLAARFRQGNLPTPDFVAWPENGTDMDPFQDAATGQAVARALRATGTPILVGTITSGPGANERQTAALWWHPTRGVQARYDKRNIVPFGEWVPYRDILEPIFPVVAYVGAQSVAGTKPGVLPVTLDDGRSLRLGNLICFDVAYGETIYDTVRYGGQVLIVQSSNAMYTGTGQIHQQFAITRARAAELRREILVVTTTGTSGLIRADGSVAFTLPEHQPASGVVALPLRQNITPATWVAPILDPGFALATLIGVGLTVSAARRRSPAR